MAAAGRWAGGATRCSTAVHLARALDAVVITINYRLGSLGWLWHPALAAGPDAAQGNWGLLDQVAALRWVAAHAAGFGGDPARVTVAGESAGAGSVLHLLGHPAATALFQRAIAQSPPLHELVIDAERGRAWTVALCEQLGCGSDVAAALPRLRELDADRIVAAQEELLAGAFRGTRGGAMPILDAPSLPADPARAPEAGIDVPLLTGTNHDEGTFFFRAGGRRLDPSEPELETMVARLAHSDDPAGLIAATRETLSEQGRPTSANDVICATVTEAWFAAPGRRYARARAAAGGRGVSLPDRPPLRRGRPRRGAFDERAAAVRQLARGWCPRPAGRGRSGHGRRHRPRSTPTGGASCAGRRWMQSRWRPILTCRSTAPSTADLAGSAPWRHWMRRAPWFDCRHLACNGNALH